MREINLQRKWKRKAGISIIHRDTLSTQIITNFPNWLLSMLIINQKVRDFFNKLFFLLHTFLLSHDQNKHRSKAFASTCEIIQKKFSLEVSSVNYISKSQAGCHGSFLWGWRLERSSSPLDTFSLMSSAPARALCHTSPRNSSF